MRGAQRDPVKLAPDGFTLYKRSFTMRKSGLYNFGKAQGEVKMGFIKNNQRAHLRNI
jgi:hypothetical protein